MANLRMPQTQREQLMVFVGVLGFLGAGAYWYYAYSPATARLAVESVKIDSLNENIETLKTALKSGTIDVVKAQAQAYSENLDAMRRLVPTGNEVVELLDQISNSARRAGLELGKLNPLGVETGVDFDAYRYALSVTGGYHDVAAFLTNIGSLPRIVVPTNVQINVASANAGVQDPKRTVVTTFEVHTYVAHTAPPPTAKGGG